MDPGLRQRIQVLLTYHGSRATHALSQGRTAWRLNLDRVCIASATLATLAPVSIGSLELGRRRSRGQIQISFHTTDTVQTTVSMAIIWPVNVFQQPATLQVQIIWLEPVARAAAAIGAPSLGEQQSQPMVQDQQQFLQLGPEVA